jgi:hypothetical protein
VPDFLKAPSPGIEGTLAERGKRYGPYTGQATISQNLQDLMRSTPGWARMRHDARDALSLIASKIARMLNGNPDYADNWHDIQGYAKLIEDRINQESKNDD